MKLFERATSRQKSTLFLNQGSGKEVHLCTCRSFPDSSNCGAVNEPLRHYYYQNNKLVNRPSLRNLRLTVESTDYPQSKCTIGPQYIIVPLKAVQQANTGAWSRQGNPDPSDYLYYHLAIIQLYNSLLSNDAQRKYSHLMVQTTAIQVCCDLMNRNNLDPEP